MNIFYIETNIYYALTGAAFDLALFLIIKSQFAGPEKDHRAFADWNLSLCITCLFEALLHLLVPGGVLTFFQASLITAAGRLPQTFFLVRYFHSYKEEKGRKARPWAVACVLMGACLYIISALFDPILITPALASAALYLLFILVESRTYGRMEEMVGKLEAETKEAEKETEKRNLLFQAVSEEMVAPLSEMKEDVRAIGQKTKRPETREKARSIEASGEMLDFLIRDIFDLVRMKEEGFALNERRFHLSEVISDLSFMMEPLAAEKDLTFACLADPSTPEIWLGDDVRLRQILINLCGNGVKYTKKGYVRLYVTRPPEGGLTFMVLDSGIGIKREDLPYLFQAYKRLDHEKNAHIQGTGLGLYIAGSLTGKMGGEIRAKSVYGRGTEFLFHIPLREGERIGDESGLLDTEKGLLYYDESDDEYQMALQAFIREAGDLKRRLSPAGEEREEVLSSLRNAAESLGARTLALKAREAEEKGHDPDDLYEVFDETIYRMKGYAGRR